jgi:hypothetical protein
MGRSQRRPRSNTHNEVVFILFSDLARIDEFRAALVEW